VGLDLRPILYVIGSLLVMLAVAMLIPMFVDLGTGDPDWPTFLVGSIITATIGMLLFLANRGTTGNLSLRQAFVLTTLAWIFLPAAAAIPISFSSLEIKYADAFFEAMSGLTTTGSTVLTGLDSTPAGVLIWRSLLQWLGGIGIVVMAVAVLPMLQVGGMQLFRMESSDTSDKILPRARQIAGAIGGLYVGLTALCVMAMLLTGVGGFDAVAHAMTTIATGGYSTHDASIGYFNNPAFEAVIVLFMIISSLPFVLFLQVLRGRPLALWQDEQARWFLLAATSLILFTAFYLMLARGYAFVDAFRFGGFNIISIMTGTGYASVDYGMWGPFSAALFFCVMLIGGCAGSTSCGIKIFRFQVVFKSIYSWTGRTLFPNGVFIATYNQRNIAEDVRTSVMSFVLFFVASLLALALALALTGLDFITALSSAATAIANVGPGLGNTVGPAGNFASLPVSAKWLMSFGMLLGRLEMFTVLVLFSPRFWRG